jgi:3-oxoacyl-[acyl-carrier protein] reductase
VDLRTEKANQIAQKINADGKQQAIAVIGDVTDQSYIDQLVKQAAEFGNGKIHIIVNNAGFTWDAVIHKVCRLDYRNIQNAVPQREVGRLEASH